MKQPPVPVSKLPMDRARVCFSSGFELLLLKYRQGKMTVFHVHTSLSKRRARKTVWSGHIISDESAAPGASVVVKNKYQQGAE